MKLEIAGDEVRIECSGIEYLKLKAALIAKIGSSLKAEKNLITFPTYCLPMAQDVLSLDDADAGIKDRLERYKKHGSAREKALEILGSDNIDDVPDNWKGLLDPAQAVAVAAMTLPDLLGLCLFDEQGSGKTVMTIAAFDILKSRGIVDAMIVVCPKSMMSEWPKDIDRFLPNKYLIEVAEGDKREKYQASLKKFDVLVTNYEGVEHMRISLSAAASQKSFLLVVDESFYLKNSDSYRSDAARKLRDVCKRCFVLCGTPAPNSPHDLVNQFDLADLGYTFGSFDKSRDPEADRDKISELVETRGVFVRRLKTEILDEVPDKNFHVIRIPLKGKQALMYEKARADLELELKGLDNTSFKKRLVTYFQRRAALLQICASPSSIDPTMAETPVKFEHLDALLEELISAGRKVILWSFYKKSLDELAERYARFKPVRIDGSIDNKTRKEAVKLFQEDPTRMVFIGNPAAAGAGITLHAAYDAVYVSYSNQAAHYLQSLDRIHRRGQKAKEVNYYLLVCEGTIEETEVLRLRGKELQQHSLLGDNIKWPTGLDDALQELSYVKV